MKLLFGLLLSCISCQSVQAGTPALIDIPAGTFIQGSDSAERETAYQLDEAAYGHSTTRKQQWYAGEYPRQTVNTAAYEIEWEKAARGLNGNYFPRGNTFDATRLNTHDNGQFGTTEVGQYQQGASPFGLQDAAGQVFEWTLSKQGNNRMIVKGGSWDDKGCGVCRPAARHGRPSNLKHTLIGFRLVQTPN